MRHNKKRTSNYEIYTLINDTCTYSETCMRLNENEPNNKSNIVNHNIKKRKQTYDSPSVPYKMVEKAAGSAKVCDIFP